MISAAIDTSAGISLAISKDQQILGNYSLDLPMGALAQLAPLVTTKCQELGLKISDINHWVTGTGPGSFTGIRIGVAFVKAAALASGATYQGITTSLGLALRTVQEHPKAEFLAVIYDGRKGELLVDEFQVINGKPKQLGVPQVIKQTDLHGLMSRMDALVTLHRSVVEPLLDNEQLLKTVFVETPDAAQLLAAIETIPSDRAAMENSCEPVYVRPPVFVAPRPIRHID